MTSSDSNNAGPGRGLPARAFEAFGLLFADHRTIGLAVSGGSDSTALLVLASEWARQRGREIAATTVNHGLRPEAAGEAQQVARLCDTVGIPHDTLTWLRPEKPGLVSQAEARRARHGLLATWAKDRGAAIVALGHTRDDRIETFLMRARQGSGWHGLAGPLPLAPSPAWPEGDGVRLARPLLAFGREELRARLTATSVEWIDDPSNSADRFERVRIRALIGDLAPSASQKALRVMDGLAQMRAAVLAHARSALARLEISPDEAWLPADRLAGLGAEARVRLIEALVMAAGGAEGQPRREAVDRLVWRLASSKTGAGGMTLAGAWIRWDAGPNARISFAQAPARSGLPEGVGPSWTRAEALLADPALTALAV